MKCFLLTITILLLTFVSFAQGDSIRIESQVAVTDIIVVADSIHGEDVTDVPKKIYVFPIRENIMPSAARLSTKCFDNALAEGADYVVIDMDTYGGLVDVADSIRTRIINFPKPVYMFINNQAASAGALISLAADKIYMREGASIGAATVVDQEGDQAPDKYQSFMRGMMRSTAESHGKVVDKVVRGDTTWRWFRDPLIAEGMVDASIVIPGIKQEGKVITFSTDEAIKWNYCEGKVSSVEELLTKAGIDNYTITEYRTTTLDKIIGFMTNPAFQGLMIMLIIGGIYFELQSPGIGFPLVVAVLGALLYFAPLYLEGVLANWELIVFILGIVLIIVEIFVTPGFGVIGIAGIVAVVVGLTFAMIDTDLLKYIPTGELSIGFILRPLGLVIIAVAGSTILSIILGRRVLVGESTVSRKVVLKSAMTPQQGYISRATDRGLRGREGSTNTALRPAGRVEIDGVLYEAAGENGMFIERGEQVVVVRDEGGVLYCRYVK